MSDAVSADAGPDGADLDREGFGERRGSRGRGAGNRARSGRGSAKGYGRSEADSERAAARAARAEEAMEADPEAVARTIVLQKLTAQSRTRGELAKALKAKDVPEEAAANVLDRMESVGLVNDAEFANDWVSSRQARRHLSKGALRRELTTKGVDRDDIDAALEQVGVEDEYAAAKELAEKKLRSMSSLDRPVQYRRLAGALARRGFGSGVTSQVLAEVLNADPDPDESGA